MNDTASMLKIQLIIQGKKNESVCLTLSTTVLSTVQRKFNLVVDGIAQDLAIKTTQRHNSKVRQLRIRTHKTLSTYSFTNKLPN